MLQRLVEGGSTVIAIEHNLDVVSQADHVIDVGPGAGHEGGQVVFTGTPAELTTEGAERMLLEVRVDNDDARAFYAANGYAEIARRPRYYADGAAAVVLERDLSR